MAQNMKHCYIIIFLYVNIITLYTIYIIDIFFLTPKKITNKFSSENRAKNLLLYYIILY